MRDKHRVIQDIRKEEVPFVSSMFLYFFLVITTFWTLKPLKKGLFIEFYEESGFYIFDTLFSAAQAELIAKVANMVFAGIAVVVFSILSKKMKRERLTLAFGGFQFFVLLCITL